MDRRIFLVVIDGFGIGEAPDAKKYGDEGSNTFGNLFNIAKMNIPNLERLGLSSIDGLNFDREVKDKVGVYARLQEKSNGKDTTTGHFEMMKIITSNPFPTYPNGFPKEVVEELEKAWGTKVLGNVSASGTQIIKELGKEHIKTKRPIIYTSADSVLQIATHTDVYPLEELYFMCEKARNIMVGKHGVGRVIARPFCTNESGEFERINTARKDYALLPPIPNTMSILKENGIEVLAVGKIEDIFAHQNITKSFPNHTNQESLEVLKDLSKKNFNGMCFVNLVDTDMLYGHRNDIQGYAHAIEEIDKSLPYIMENMTDNDYLIITADHGCDPTTPSTDHSREYVPLLIYSKKMKSSKNLGTILGFDNVGIFIEKCFNISNTQSIIFDEVKGVENESR
ncbi:MAG: phosphopentomutase [Clostridiales bacterium]|nr:phosphopentomutase [Candidatus Apopatousia equi]